MVAVVNGRYVLTYTVRSGMLGKRFRGHARVFLDAPAAGDVPVMELAGSELHRSDEDAHQDALELAMSRLAA